MSLRTHKWLPLFPAILFFALLATSSLHSDQTLSGDLTLEEWRLLHDGYSQRVINAVKMQDREMLRQIYQEAGERELFPEWLLDYNFNLLKSCRKNAVLFTGDDLDTTAAWYLQQQGIRKDVSVIPIGLLNQEWFRFALVGPNHFLPTCPLHCSCNTFSDSTRFGRQEPPDQICSNAIERIMLNHERPIHFSLNCDESFLYPFHDQLVRYGMTWVKSQTLKGDSSNEHLSILRNIYFGKKGFLSVRSTLANPEIRMPQSINLQYIDMMRSLYRSFVESGNIKDASQIKMEIESGLGKHIIFRPDYF